MIRRKVEPANSLTHNSQIIEFSIKLSACGTEVSGILMLRIKNHLPGEDEFILTDRMEFIGKAVGSHWHMSRKDPTEKFCDWDGHINTKAIRFLIYKANILVLERERPVQFAEEQEAAVA